MVCPLRLVTPSEVAQARPAASVYAVIISPTAVVSRAGSTTLHGGPVASTVYIIPVTSAQVKPVIDAPVIGLVPMFPVIADAGTSVIPDSDRIAKPPAVPRFTADGEAAWA